VVNLSLTVGGGKLRLISIADFGAGRSH